jgi:hypothetical protein
MDRACRKDEVQGIYKEYWWRNILEDSSLEDGEINGRLI